MNRQHIHFLLNIILVIGLLTGGCRNGTKSYTPKNKVPIRTTTIQQSPVSIPIRSAGMLKAKTEQKLSFKTGGLIQDIYVTEGQSVEKGTKLARLNLEEIKAKYNKTQAKLQKAKRDLRRVRELYKDSVATLEDYQNAQTAVEAARSDMQVAQFNMEHSTIKAPSDGEILKKLAEENEMTGAGHPVLLFGSTSSKWIIQTSVTDQSIVSLEKGDSARVTFDAYPGETFTGKIYEVANAANPKTNTFEVKVELNRYPEKLISGLIANVKLYPHKEKSFFLVPMDALIEASGKIGYIYEMIDNQAVKRKIHIRDIKDSCLVIEKGIEEGAEVITQGVHYIESNSKVAKKK